MIRSSQRAGFTLVEMIVAIAVLAIAFAGASRSVSAGIDAQAQLKLRTLAGWIAENRLAEHHALNRWLELGKSEGQVQMAGEAFIWTETISSTPNPQFRRIDVSVAPVSAGRDAELAKRTGFLTGPGSES